MEMTYNGKLVMPENYSEMTENDMIYVDGGGKAYLKIGKNSIIINVLANLGKNATKEAMKKALIGAGASIAAAIELGTAGVGTLWVGAFILAWGDIIPTIAAEAVSYGISSLKGKKFKIASGWLCPNITIPI